jgi:hypothetical protein
LAKIGLSLERDELGVASPARPKSWIEASQPQEVAA